MLGDVILSSAVDAPGTRSNTHTLPQSEKKEGGGGKVSIDLKVPVSLHQEKSVDAGREASFI